MLQCFRPPLSEDVRVVWMGRTEELGERCLVFGEEIPGNRLCDNSLQQKLVLEGNRLQLYADGTRCL